MGSNETDKSENGPRVITANTEKRDGHTVTLELSSELAGIPQRAGDYLHPGGVKRLGPRHHQPAGPMQPRTGISQLIRHEKDANGKFRFHRVDPSAVGRIAGLERGHCDTTHRRELEATVTLSTHLMKVAWSPGPYYHRQERAVDWGAVRKALPLI